MARLVAVANGLYYPTPLRIIAGIADRLTLPTVSPGPQCTLRVLDPCAGRGSAALFLTRLLTLTRTGNAGLQDVGQSQNGSGAELFGIELDRTRAELAAPHFTRLLQTNTLSARVEQKAFDLILHNPPYHSSGDGDKRLEHSFLKRVTAYLKPGGVLLHIVPQSRLAISAEFLAHYYTDIEVLRFPLPEYEVFRQVVLLGVRREYALEDSRTARRLKNLAEAGPSGLSPLICPAQVGLVEKLVEEATLPHYPEVVEELERLRKHPPLAETGEDRITSTLTLTPTSTPTNTATSTFSTSSIPTAPQYLLPLSTASRPVSPFASTEYNPAQALAEARQNGVWANPQLREMVGEVGQGQGQRTSGHLGNREQAGVLYRPLTPLREGQAAMLTAVGLLNNLVLEDEGGQRVLVKGRTFKEYRLRRIERDEDGSVKSRTEREVVRSQLTALDLQTGEATEIEQSDMAAFIQRSGPSIRRQMLTNYPPLYVPGQAQPITARLETGLTRLGRKPLGGQSVAIVAGAYSLILNGCAIFSAEMGGGKSLMGAAAAWLAGGRRVIVECPPQLVKKWVREIEGTIPGAKAEIVTDVSELRRAVRRIQHFEATVTKTSGGIGGVRPGQLSSIGKEALPPYFVVISRTDLKLSSRWQGAATFRKGRNAEGQLVRLAYCPRCGSPVTDRDGKGVSGAELSRKKLRCDAPRRVWNRTTKSWADLTFGKSGKPLRCDEPLWQLRCSPIGERSGAFTGASERLFAAPGDTLRQEGPRKVPLAHYIKNHLDGFFDTLIEDEVHETKAHGSAQGASAGQLAEAVRRVISLTGTLSGGKASNLFYVLWRFSRDIRREFGLDEEDLWVQKYGIVERTIFTSSEDNREVEEDGAMSDRREFSRERRIEKPGMNPAILLKLIGCTVFLKLADVARDLPSYTEKVVTLPLDGKTDDLDSQAGQYARLEKALIVAVKVALQNGSSRLLGAMANSLLAWPDNPTRDEIVLDPKDKKQVACAMALPAGQLYPKEQALLDLYRQERAAGRRMLVFLSNTKSRSIVARVKEVLEGAGARVAFLNSDRIKPEDREEWVARQVEAGVDVLLSHPKPIQTGLDLLMFPTLVFYQLQYSTYVMRQASRRSWRIGQHLPITVYHLVYEGTAQYTGLTLLAKKVRASQLLEGELGNEGLVEMADDGEDGESLLELARAIAGVGAGAGAGSSAGGAADGFSQSSPVGNYDQSAVGGKVGAVTANDFSADGMKGLSLESLFNSLHQQELEAARFVLEDEGANPAQLEAAIERIYTAATAAATGSVVAVEPMEQGPVPAQVFEASQSGQGSGMVEGRLSAPDESRQLLLPIPASPPASVVATPPETEAEERVKPTLDELRETLLSARKERLGSSGGGSSKKKVQPVSTGQLSMF